MSVTDSEPLQIALAASSAAKALAYLPARARNDSLTAIHHDLAAAKDEILAASGRDIAAATAKQPDGSAPLSQSLINRLDLRKPGKFEEMLKGILDVRDLEDPGYMAVSVAKTIPVGRVTLRTRLDDGLELERVSCPIGVLLIIFEARPEVIANITALAIKSGNAAILKGGRESAEAFAAISAVVARALARTRVPRAAIQLVRTRDAIPGLLALDRHIDLVIPRGSNELVSYVKRNTRIPVLGHADGLCCMYVHRDADAAMAARVVRDAKLGYPAACNSVETLLVHSAALGTAVFAGVAEALMAGGTQLRCDEPSRAAVLAVPSCARLLAADASLVQLASEEDYKTEFLAPILAVRTITPSQETAGDADRQEAANGGEPEGEDEDMAYVDAAIEHINGHSSHHTDSILTSNEAVAKRFLAGVDSAGVYWNASTRMADGLRYGFGTEVGISTNKIHARGPVGLEGLTIYKYLIRGSGQIAGEYHEGKGGKRWKHERLL